ncbi:MAG: hypothetical protein CVV17_05925, partial [Gammaproteobacteria bacterium HGW-Gammaproteobacteria-7]
MRPVILLLALALLPVPSTLAAQSGTAEITGTWRVAAGADVKEGPKEVIIRADSSASWGKETVRWRVRDNLIVTAGLRWDYDDITKRGQSSADLNNFQPRLSFNWLASPTTVIRGSAGLYSGTLPYAVFSDAVQFGPNGNAVVTFADGSG